MYLTPHRNPQEGEDEAPPRPSSAFSDNSEQTIDEKNESQQSTLYNNGTTNLETNQVYDDPLKWSPLKKNVQLMIVTFAALCYSINVNIHFPAIEEIKLELKSSDELMAASVALYFLGAGIGPLVWSAFAEIYGKKIIYISSMSSFLVCCIVTSLSPNNIVFLIFRVASAFSGSAAVSLGAGTLVDIYQPEIRSSKLGIYYIASLVGPSVGNLLGGAISSAANWRAAFYFLSGLVFLSVISFTLAADTFRKERSVAWSVAYKKALDQHKSRDGDPVSAESFKPKLRDVNPFSAIVRVCKNFNVLIAQICTGLLYGLQFSLSFTGGNAFAEDPWNHTPLFIGCILASYGLGQIIGSVCGGHISDWMLRRNKGISSPELRIIPTYFVVPGLLLFTCIAGWAIESQWHIATIIVFFVFGGLCGMWCFSSLLSFIVDSSPGQSTIAVAGVSTARGIFGLAGVQIATPVYDNFGQGVLYTGWTVILLFSFVALYIGIYINSRRRKGQNDNEA